MTPVTTPTPSLLPADAVNGFWIGSISTLVASGINQMQKVQDGEMSSKSAMIKSTKHALDGGIALGAAAHAAGQIRQNKWLNAFGSVVAGAAAIYAVEKIHETLNDESCDCKEGEGSCKAE